MHTVNPQAFYPGIKMQRPDVYGWYIKQGPERPIYLCEKDPAIRASVAYPIEAVEAEFGAGRFGCQLDYMVALALHEKFEKIIFCGVGQPYVDAPNSDEAKHWLHHHKTVYYWMGQAEARGVELEFAGPCINAPFADRYGYDMNGTRG